ncbi:unnamed protein product [Thelazia callipaeda]|uniref:ANK_REP_REGION domain-containing protein n=1 Tax=Thelazia callipaeda TaxID=103827 RepID=A0A0N5CWJ0_THECL|nr:unnamed protein product [Thelazia callipaeda]
MSTCTPQYYGRNPPQLPKEYLTSTNLNNTETASDCIKNINGNGSKDSWNLNDHTTPKIGTNDFNGMTKTNESCVQCYHLKKQFYELSLRLQEATEEIKLRSINELNNQREKTLITDRSLYKLSAEMSDAAVQTIKLEQNDTGTNISLIDQMGDLFTDMATSPVPQPRFYSIAISTDDQLLLTSRQDVATDLPDKYLLAPKLSHNNDSYADSVTTVDCACGNDFSLAVCDISSATDPIAVKDSFTMTLPIMHHSHSIQTSQINTTLLICYYRSLSVCTIPTPMVTRGVDAQQIVKKDSCTTYDDLLTEKSDENLPNMEMNEQAVYGNTVASQTEFEPEQSEPRILNDTEIAESLWLLPTKERKDVAVGNEDVIENLMLNDVISQNLQHQVLLLDIDEDEVCVMEESLSDPEAVDFESFHSEEKLPMKQHIVNDPNLISLKTKEGVKVSESRVLGHARAAVVKKMLTEKSPQLSFIRGAVISKSCRSSSRKGNSLQYIADQHKATANVYQSYFSSFICHTRNDFQKSSPPSTPQKTNGALKEKVILKKDLVPSSLPILSSEVPEPVPARIPRPKISKYNPGETVPQSPDEEAELADRLTPLRSEMRTLRTYSNGRAVTFPRVLPNAPPKMSPTTFRANKPVIFDDSSSSSSDSEGSYDTNENNRTVQFHLTEQLSEAVEILNKYFEKSDSVKSAMFEWAKKFTKHEWLKTAARKTASSVQVEGFIHYLKATSNDVLKFVVNLTDPNENTSLHYAVSHGNFDVVSVLLDSRVCNLDRANKAGYTAVMLAALCDASDEVESAVIHRLFQLGNVNAQAVQHGQTALMLAASHGKIKTTKLLIDCQADLNIQDEEGSTALMCAAEHGHQEIVKLLLEQPQINASLSDCDSSTALSIAVENGHREIGVLIYAHLNHACKNVQQQSVSTS